ncbi:hypothetical protein [Sabulicella rubraurantiaca]|uniref:hypothetical protein n=1 Tax=Sabulicella rubraurantiaca TaxID=2811429 RepID=UPI001A96F08B|nr:hypothetical protein [Sabulicella rubraurantiaca]
MVVVAIHISGDEKRIAVLEPALARNSGANFNVDAPAATEVLQFRAGRVPAWRLRKEKPRLSAGPSGVSRASAVEAGLARIRQTCLPQSDAGHEAIGQSAHDDAHKNYLKHHILLRAVAHSAYGDCDASPRACVLAKFLKKGSFSLQEGHWNHFFPA